MRYSLAVILLCALVAFSARPVMAQDGSVPESPALQALNQQFAKGGAVPEASASAELPVQLSPSTVFRDIPSISGRYSVGGRVIMPYLGAGFGGGYASELNRSLTGPPPAQTDLGLRSQFGQGISPNEFQLGLRIPF